MLQYRASAHIWNFKNADAVFEFTNCMNIFFIEDYSFE